MTRPVRCGTHGLVKRCTACEATRVPTGTYPTLDVPRGTVEWLRESAVVFAMMSDKEAVAEHVAGHPASNDGCPICYVEWTCVDLREGAA